MNLNRSAMCMAAGLLFLVGCGPSNPLIGPSWQRTSGGGGCPVSLKFSNDQMVSDGIPRLVTYIVSPKKDYVMTELGNNYRVEYDIVDSNHISFTTAYGTCSYAK